MVTGEGKCSPEIHDCRYEDNGDAVNNITVISRPTSKNSIEEYGSTDQFLTDISFLLGEQTFSGARGSMSDQKSSLA